MAAEALDDRKGSVVAVDPQTGEIIALSPPLILEEEHIDEMVDTLRKVLSEVA